MRAGSCSLSDCNGVTIEMEAFGRLFGSAFSKIPVVIGMIHLLPLPGMNIFVNSVYIYVCVVLLLGTPGYGGETLKEIAFQACQEGRIYNKYGLVIIMYDCA